ncbi:MAG TPA: hypothetical protein VFJ58_24645 [Armatimonadota bacterium]|nr:hypothetical protein [Armatimonadota bacterium]
MRCKTCGGPAENEELCRKCGERSLATTHLRSGRRTTDTPFPKIPWLLLIMANLVAGLLVLHPMQPSPDDYGPVFAVSAPSQSAAAPADIAVPVIGLGSPAVAILETSEPAAPGANDGNALAAHHHLDPSKSHQHKSDKTANPRIELPGQPVANGVSPSNGVIPRG